LCRQSLRHVVCSLRSETTDLVPQELENPEIDIQVDQIPFGAVGRNACATSAITHGVLSIGHAFGFVYKAQSMTEIIAHVEAGHIWHLAVWGMPSDSLGRDNDASPDT
jgi:hypothetical protein